MDRELKKLHLSDGTEISLVTYVTWGEKNRIDGVLLNNAEINQAGTGKLNKNAMYDYKKNAIVQCVKTASKGETELTINDEWVENLKVEDGDMIWNEIENMLTPKKK